MRITKAEIKFIHSLAQRKIRDAERKFIVEGWKSLDDALHSEYRILLVATTAEHVNDPGHSEVFRILRSRKIAIKELNSTELKQSSDTVHSQGVVAIAEQRTVSLGDAMTAAARLLVLADRVADPGNLGTMIRTCDWFSVDAFLLSVGCVDAYNEKVVRSTSGSIFHIPVVESILTKDAIPLLKKNGYRVFATAGDAKLSFNQAKYGEKNLLIFGNEASGISEDTRSLADDIICIPRQGKAESLNVGVACGVILSHLSYCL